ncbi:MAG: hypothetical protein ACREEA_08150, partial [Stellaceae bacterium]
LYAKLTQAVIAERALRQAIVYFGANAGPGAARPAYIAEVLAAARSWPLPAAGVEALERLRGDSGCARKVTRLNDFMMLSALSRNFVTPKPVAIRGGRG